MSINSLGHRGMAVGLPLLPPPVRANRTRHRQISASYNPVLIYIYEPCKLALSPPSPSSLVVNWQIQGCICGEKDSKDGNSEYGHKSKARPIPPR